MTHRQRRTGGLWGAAFAVLAAPALAQTGNFELELNTAAEVAEACRLTFVATNGTGLDLTAASYEVAVFDAGGTVPAMYILEFGALPQNKTRVVQFDLPKLACTDLSRILVNGQDACTSAAGEHEVCLKSLSATSRIPSIPFGL